ncbi:MAG: UvrD-helicase domain-containing protein [Akkermansiaceae bacterium]
MNILEKNLMILASAGSGKTYQLGNRVIGKIALEGVSPERIVALTFTRKAAGEFADSILTKLAKGTLDSKVAAELSSDLGAEIDVPTVLEQVVKALPRLQLTTMDGFFNTVVRSFQYELGITGGTFELLQGARKKMAEAEIIDAVLQDEFSENENFFHAFRRATLGRPGQGVRKTLDDFLKDWYGLWKTLDHDSIGVPLFGDLPNLSDYEEQKQKFISLLRDDTLTDQLEAQLECFENHSLSRSLKLNSIGTQMLEQIEEDEVEFLFRKKPIDFNQKTWPLWQELFGLLIKSELAASIERTKPVLELVALIDSAFEKQLKKRGLLSFDDIKTLLGDGFRSEEGRVKRQLIDYRLDGRYDHWLLDEFQDTSYADWNGLASLIDEAVDGDEGGLFVVGDRKQAIYGWRGGDVTIFDKLISNYQDGTENELKVEPMSKSFRSCSAVLDLVNATCGDGGIIERLFGKPLRDRWLWEDHVSAKPKVTGEAKVVTTEKDDEGAAMIAQMKALGVGKKKMSCGVLVRKGEQVEQYADLLRNEGFDVIEEGQRKPGTDHAVGVVLTHVLAWLADPADNYAREVIGMSPLDAVFEKLFPEGSLSRWEGALKLAQEHGYASLFEILVEPEWEALSDYGKRRASDLIQAMREFDASGDAAPRAARDWVHELQVSQAPGAAAVQVMTIHKSKGLGFDLVMLPSFDDNQAPSATRFKIVRGDGWLLQAPSKMIREQVPALQDAYDRWGDEQRYETMCLLYVALTRSKRGLYVFLDPVSPSRVKKREDVDWSSPANLIRQTVGEDFQSGDPNWTADIPEREHKKKEALPQLGNAILLRSRSTPSAAKGAIVGGGTGRRIGNEVHALFEKIEWLAPSEVPDLPRSQAGKIVEDTLKDLTLHQVFENQGAQLFREQQVELILDEKWVTGIVDRMHVYGECDEISRIEIIDFKTDAVDLDELVNRYAGQMENYRRAIAKVFDVEAEKVSSRMLSTHLGALIDPRDQLKQGELGL